MTRPPDEQEADPLTQAESAFRSLLSHPCAYSEWAERVRARWAKTEAGRKAVERMRKERG